MRRKIEVQTETGKVIRRKRAELGMSQLDLAAKTGIGISRLKQYESGAKLPSSDAVIAIADAFNCDLFELVGLDEKNTPSDVLLKIRQSIQEGMSINGYLNSIGYSCETDFHHDVEENFEGIIAGKPTYDRVYKYCFITDSNTTQKYRVLISEWDNLQEQITALVKVTIDGFLKNKVPLSAPKCDDK